MEIRVSTKDELKEAINKKYSKIVVIGELASDLKKVSVIKKLSASAIGTLTAAITAAIATAPPTGGSSLLAFKFAAPTIAAKSGLDAAVVIIAASLGISLIIALFKDYNVKWTTRPDGTMEAEFSRK